jgi:hypothetical protein
LRRKKANAKGGARPLAALVHLSPQGLIVTDVEFAKKIVKDRLGLSAFPLQGSIDKSISTFAELGATTKLNFEAAAASATVAGNAAQAFGAQAMSFSKILLGRQMEAARAFAGVRNIKDLIELQTTFAKSTVEVCTAEAAKTSDMLKTAAEAAIKPLSSRVAATLGVLQAGVSAPIAAE